MKNIFTAGLNHYLDYDPERVSQLQQIEGKVIALTIRQLEITLYLQVTELRLEKYN